MLNKRIRELRMSYGISQVDLAKNMGVTKQSVSNWENDNIQPSIDMLIKLADYFMVTTDYLLGLESIKTIDVSDLTDEQVAHIKLIVSDITGN